MQTTKRINTGSIISNSLLKPGYCLMHIKLPEIAKIAHPGQFVMVKITDMATDPLLRIPLVIYDINQDNISLLYHIVGNGTKLLSKKQNGEKISLLGPLGNGFNLQKSGTALLVAGGFGIAPLYLPAKKLIATGCKVVVFIGAYSEEHILCERLFSELGAEVQISTEDGSRGSKGYVTELVKNYLVKNPEIKQTCVYASGPNPMLEVLAALVNKMEVPAQLSLEAYMACGIGVCRGCAIMTTEGYKMCCQDGPVFNSKIIKKLL